MCREELVFPPCRPQRGELWVLGDVAEAGEVATLLHLVLPSGRHLRSLPGIARYDKKALPLDRDRGTRMKQG